MTIASATDLARMIRKVHFIDREEVFKVIEAIRDRVSARGLQGDPTVLETLLSERLHAAHSAVVSCQAAVDRDSRRLLTVKRSLAEAMPTTTDGLPWLPSDNLSSFTEDELPLRLERAKVAVQAATRMVELFEQLGDRITSTPEERKAAADAALTALWRAQPTSALIQRARAASYSFGGSDRTTIIRVLVEHGEIP